jgi:asparagine synthase (glutamine-hydrolysing)
MCGLAGLFLPTAERAEVLDARVRTMTAALTHRGPDDEGIWTAPDAGLAIGFRRLSIIDLSPAGHQPMASPTSRFTAAFNGEIYNHRALRLELERSGVRFRGHSDTEVMLASFERWGVRETLPRLTGMFAIAVWDSVDRTLTLVRDRLGKKPLFYWHDPRAGLLFGSELKALCADSGFPRRLDVEALALYFRYLYVPAPRSIYRDTWKLPPGHLLTIRSSAIPLPAPECYWNLGGLPDEDRLQADGSDESRLTDDLEVLLRDAVRLRPSGPYLHDRIRRRGARRVQAGGRRRQAPGHRPHGHARERAGSARPRSFAARRGG